MIERYVEERFPRWFVFGRHTNGLDVNIASANDESICCTNKYIANNIIKERDELVDMVYKLADTLDKIDSDKFKEIWYGVQKEENK